MGDVQLTMDVTTGGEQVHALAHVAFVADLVVGQDEDKIVVNAGQLKNVWVDLVVSEDEGISHQAGLSGAVEDFVENTLLPALQAQALFELPWESVDVGLLFALPALS